MESRNGTVRGMLDLWPVSCFNSSQILRGVMEQGCSPKKEVGVTPETRLRQRFVNSLGLHTRTLIHVRKIATSDLWSCPAIQLLVFECL